MNKILITGGCGFIGSHIVENFLSKKFIVTVVDLWKSTEIIDLEKKYQNLNVMNFNILDFEKLEKVIKENNYMIHMAAILGTLETITTYDIEEVVKTNVLGTTKILKIAKKYDLKKVLIPTTPDVSWINPYKITKQAIEKIAQLFNHEYGLNVSCLKLGNIYGPRERWLEAKDVNMNCPFNYQKFGKEVIHVGSGKNFSVLDIIDGLEKAWGRKLIKNFVKMRPGEHKIEIALNPEPMKRLLNYELKYNLVDGLKKTIPYYEEQFKIQKNLNN